MGSAHPLLEWLWLLVTSPHFALLRFYCSFESRESIVSRAACCRHQNPYSPRWIHAVRYIILKCTASSTGQRRLCICDSVLHVLCPHHLICRPSAVRRAIVDAPGAALKRRHNPVDSTYTASLQFIDSPAVAQPVGPARPPARLHAPATTRSVGETKEMPCRSSSQGCIVSFSVSAAA